MPVPPTAPGTSQSSERAIVTVIEPARGWLKLDLRELWRYRDLFALLVRRDLVARYRQSVLGISWAVIRPVLAMLVFTFVFSRVAGIPSDGSPYPLFAFSALIPWLYFSGTLTAATGSIVGSSHVIQKVYFPRLILPLVSSVTGLVELLIQLVVLGFLMGWYRFIPDLRVAAAPLFVVMAGVTALAVGLWLTALNVRYRDVGQGVPFLTQIWMWLCPIVYSSNAIPEHIRPVYGLNPMVGIIEGFRWSLLGSTTPDWTMMGVSFSVTLVLLVTGVFYFRRTETTFADVI